jgi:hypothetical protein
MSWIRLRGDCGEANLVEARIGRCSLECAAARRRGWTMVGPDAEQQRLRRHAG